MKYANLAILITNLLLFGFLALFIWRGAPALAGWEYKDVVSVLLTTVTVILAALAILLGVAAFWSYQKITEHASRDAVGSTQGYLRSDEFAAIVSTIVAAKIENDMQTAVGAELRIEPEMPNHQQPRPDEPWDDNNGRA